MLFGSCTAERPAVQLLGEQMGEQMGEQRSNR
jgi:hypothetical protein